MSFAPIIAAKLGIRVAQIETVLTLLQEGSTIPFIARYRKDSTGNLDEVQIQQIQDEQKIIQAFTERKVFIEKTIVEQGKMTEELQARINTATTLLELEDIYLPYKVKRKTKAVVARENGLDPLANFLLEQGIGSVETEAAKYFNEKITTIEEALQGARDIIAENVNENA
ncbi:MAG: RNA-binding transcriptional accessory protein, partial [Sphingobacteriia bacterium]